MRCHICGKYLDRRQWLSHLQREHLDFYRSSDAYVRLTHERKYGKEKSRYMLSKLLPRMGRRGTIAGMIMAFVGLIVFAVLANVFWPLMQTLVVGLDPDLQLLLNFAFIIIGIGIIVEIINDSSRGERPVYYGAPQ